jgi:hypothetical protein
MLVTMVNDSFTKRSVLYVVIEKDNLERMEKADPFTLEAVREGGVMPPIEFPDNFNLLIAYEPNSEELQEMARRGGFEFMRYLERGRVWKPEVDGVANVQRITRDDPK